MPSSGFRFGLGTAKNTAKRTTPASPAAPAPGKNGWPTAAGSNDTGAAGIGAVPTSKSGAVKTSKIWNISIAAATTANGVTTNGSLIIPTSGTQFYVIVASAAVLIRTSNGTFNSYTGNQKLKVLDANAFESIEIQNGNAFPVALSIFVGWDDFTSYQFTLQNSALPQITYATNPEPNTSARINIPDLSGQAFAAADGSNWIAVARVAIIISNEDASQVLRLVGGLNAANQNAGVVTIQPKTAIAHQSGGNFCMTINNETDVNAVVSEIYLSLPA